MSIKICMICSKYPKSTKNLERKYRSRFLLYSQRKQYIENEERSADNSDSHKHRHYHRLYALNIRFPYRLCSCGSTVIGLLFYLLSACTRHINDSRAIVVVHYLWLFLFCFFIAHNQFSSIWQAAKCPGSYSLY